MPIMEMPIGVDELTPIERHGKFWVKRDDLFRVAGTNGGKARACWTLARGSCGLTTGSHRVSTQMKIVARQAAALGIPCRIHTALGKDTDEMTDAKQFGAEIVQWYNGFSNVLASRAEKDILESGRQGWVCIPFGMESRMAVQCTRGQVREIPDGVQRIVICVGSGMSAAGVLWGLRDIDCKLPVLGVRVGGGNKGSSIVRRLSKFAPFDWSARMTIQVASVPYDKALDLDLDGVRVDPHYESKCIEFLKPGDLFWIIGHRENV